MAKKAPREPISYSLQEIETGAVLVTEPDKVENYLVLMEKIRSEAAELLRLNPDPDNLEKRYQRSLGADRNVADDAVDRLYGSIKSIRYWMALCNWNNALIAMFEAANSYRQLLDNEFIDQLIDTDKATNARKKEQRDRRARLKEHVVANGNPPSRRKDGTARRKERTGWIKQFIAAEVSSGSKKVSVGTIRADLKYIGL